MLARLSRAANQPLQRVRFCEIRRALASGRDLFLQANRADLKAGEHAAADHRDAEHEPQRDLQLRARAAHAGAHRLALRRCRVLHGRITSGARRLLRLLGHQREQCGIECIGARRRFVRSGDRARIGNDRHRRARPHRRFGWRRLRRQRHRRHVRDGARRNFRRWAAARMATAARTAAEAAGRRPSSAVPRC